MIAALIALLAVVNSPVNSVTYACDGVTAAYTVNFPYLSSGDLVVTSIAANGVVTTLTQGTDWSVNLSSTSSTASLTLNSPAIKCPAGNTFRIVRTLALTQPKSFRQQNNYDPSVHEQAYDRAAMISQQLMALYTNPPATVLPANVTAKLNGIRFADQFASIQAAITDAGILGSVIIPPGYAGSDTYVNPNVIPIIDLRGGASAYTGVFNVKSAFGATGNGTTDDAASLQSAVNAAFAVKGKVFLPCGTYLIKSGIALADGFFGIDFEGANANCVTIKAGVAMTSIFTFADVTASGRYRFANLTLDGNHLAQYGLKSTKYRFNFTEHVVISNTTVAAISFHGGWDNVFRDSEFVNNDGDGVVIDASDGNDVLVENVQADVNGGWGFKHTGGGPVTVRGGAFQNNQKGGIYIRDLGRPAVIENVYFEANAQTGMAFSVPVKTVKADIMVNGSGVDAQMDHSFPSPNVTVKNCLFAATYTEAAIYAVAATTMNLIGNFNSSGAIPLLKTWGDSTYSAVTNVTATGNANFTADFSVESITNARPIPLSTWKSDKTQIRNYMPKNVLAITRLSGVAGTSFQRGATVYNVREAFDMTGVAGDFYGASLDPSAANPELAGKLMYVSAWVKSSSVAAGPRLTANGTPNVDSTASFATDTSWHHMEIATYMNAGATLFEMTKLGAIAGDIVSFADVVVSEVGAPDREYNRDQLKPAWAGAAAPTTGTWAQGDVVWSTAPVAGGSPGWVCTTGGTPGTWKTMANVAP